MNEELHLQMILSLVEQDTTDLLILYGASTFARAMGLKETEQNFPMDHFIKAIEEILDVQGIEYGKYEKSD